MYKSQREFMKISSVSFGRAIKVNTSLAIANKIAQAANVANYDDFSSNPKRRAMEEFLDGVFNDTSFPDGKARAIELDDGEVYILSGKEAAKEAELSKEANDKIKANEEFVYWLPDRITRRQQQIKYENINQSIKETTQTKIKRLLENGKNYRRNSSLDIHTEKIVDGNRANRIMITGITYKTTGGVVEEFRKLDLTK